MLREMGGRLASLVSALVMVGLAPGGAAAQGDAGRAVVGVFPITAPEISELDVETLNELTAQLHAVIADGSGFLTVPRAAIRRALQAGAVAPKAGDKTPDELEAIARQLDAAIVAARERLEAAKDAAEIAPDSHEGRAAHELFKIEEKIARLTRDAKAAHIRAVEVRRASNERLLGGDCASDACRAAIGARVGASKVLRSTLVKADSGACTFEVQFFDVVAELHDLILNVPSSCDAAGLTQAIATVATEMRRRDEAGYEVYKIDVTAGRAIKNPKTPRRGAIQVNATALNDPNESIELLINGKNAGRLKDGRMRLKVPHGRYIVVLKPASTLFRSRSFDIVVGVRDTLIPARGQVVLQPEFGTVDFELPEGRWGLRSGSRRLIPKESNQFRPGDVPLQFYLDNQPVGEVRIAIAPSSSTLIRVTSRPQTPSELRAQSRAWGWRKWGSAGLAAVAAGFGAERMLAARGSADDRDLALSALEATTSQAEYQRQRNVALRLDDDRGSAQVAALSLLGTAGAFAVWSALEWAFGGPDDGQLIVEGLEVVPISEVEELDGLDDKIEVSPGGPR